MHTLNITELCYHTNLPICDETTQSKDNSSSLMKTHFPAIIIACFAFALNITEIIYITSQRRKRAATEYLLLSFAVADSLYSFDVFVGMSLIIVGKKYDFFDVSMIIVIGYQIAQFTIYASIFHVLFISLERLAAVVFPYKYKLFMRTDRIKIVIYFLWLLTALLQGTMAAVEYRDGLYESSHHEDTVLHTASGITFCAGIFLFGVYGYIFYAIIKRSRYMRRTIVDANPFQTRRHKAEIIACVTGLIVSIGFIVFSFPLAISFCLPHSNFAIRFSIAAHFFLIFNSVFNPLVYFWRGQFIKVMKRKSNRRREKKQVKDVDLSTVSPRNNTRYNVSTIQSSNIMYASTLSVINASMPESSRHPRL